MAREASVVSRCPFCGSDPNRDTKYASRATVIFAASVVGLLFALGSSAWADDKESKITDLVKDATVTIDQAIKTASEKVPGTVVEAELEKKHGKTVWEVEILRADANVTEVHIDAGTGAVIDTEAKKDEKKRGAKNESNSWRPIFSSLSRYLPRLVKMPSCKAAGREDPEAYADRVR